VWDGNVSCQHEAGWSGRPAGPRSERSTTRSCASSRTSKTIRGRTGIRHAVAHPHLRPGCGHGPARRHAQESQGKSL